MKNKMNFKIIESICFVSIILIMFSCKQGFDDNETFSAGVQNTQLESPVIDATCFSTVTLSDGTENVKVTWPVVYGAGGYLFNLNIIDDPDNPEVVMQDSIVDGCSMVFEKLEDTTYEVSVLSLGNEKLNNTDAANATIYEYTTLIEATTIPEGEEIASYIEENMVSSDTEIAFELEAGKTYYLNSLIDFGLNTVTFRGNKTNRPTVIIGADGGIMTQGGLKVKFINFDCTNMETEVGVIGFGKEPDESISITSLGYTAAGANQSGYVIQNPVIIQECWFKNVNKSLVYGNKKNWSLLDFRIDDCIVQLNNATSNSVINMYGASNGNFKSFTVRNSTFYNIAANSSGYFYRLSNSSNAQPKKLFGDANNAGYVTFTNNTFVQTMTGKDFGNNICNTNTITTTVTDNIFYDVFRLYQGFATQGTRTYSGNTIRGVTNSVNSNDNGGRKDSNSNPLATEDADMSFEQTDFTKELDLDAENGGLNFKPTGGTLTVGNLSGDPRWLE